MKKVAPKDLTPLGRMERCMDEVAKNLDKAACELSTLQDMREAIGDDLFFEALDATPEFAASWERLRHTSQLLRRRNA